MIEDRSLRVLHHLRRCIQLWQLPHFQARTRIGHSQETAETTSPTWEMWSVLEGFWLLECYLARTPCSLLLLDCFCKAVSRGTRTKGSNLLLNRLFQFCLCKDYLWEFQHLFTGEATQIVRWYGFAVHSWLLFATFHSKKCWQMSRKFCNSSRLVSFVR